MNHLLLLVHGEVKPVFLFLLVCGLSLVSTVVGAAGNKTTVHKVDAAAEEAIQATPDLEQGKELYRRCALCHTPEGWGSPSGHFPQIAGQHRSVIIKQLDDINKGNRDNPTMIPFTTPIFKSGIQALADLSAYIEQLPMVPNNSVGSGMRLGEGRKLYVENCKKCHGENGEGNAKNFYPRIHGQHFKYLLRQMLWVKSSRRRNADKKMVEQFKDLRYSDIVAIADYVSRMRPDKSLVADHIDWRNPDFRLNFKTAPRGQY